MRPEFWQYLSALVVVISGLYYAVRAWQRQLFPNPVSWGIWSVVGVALFLTADASQAGAVYLSTIFGDLNPLVVAIVIFIRAKERIYSLSRQEKQCLVLASIGYALWFATKDMPEIAPWAFYWMIGVDLFALWPTWLQITKNPMSDKPFPWIVFGFGFGLAGFAISDNTVSNWALPVYVFVGANVVSIPMVAHRIRIHASWKEWL